MSKQLTLSATLCVVTMALFAIVGDKAPPRGVDLRGPTLFAVSVSIGR